MSCPMLETIDAAIFIIICDLFDLYANTPSKDETVSKSLKALRLTFNVAADFRHLLNFDND